MSTDLDQSPAAEVAFDYDNLLKIIRRRYSVRRFRPDPVPDELIEKVLEAGRWAPSGANHQPWEFIVVRDRDSIQQLGERFGPAERRHVGQRVQAARVRLRLLR